MKISEDSLDHVKDASPIYATQLKPVSLAYINLPLEIYLETPNPRRFNPL